MAVKIKTEVVVEDNSIEIDIDEDFFTNTFWKIREVKTRFRIIKGGASAGKSFAVAQDEVLKACEKYEKILVIRKVASTLKDSVYQSFLNRFKEFGIEQFIDTTLKPMDIHVQRSGSHILFRGLDDPEKIKSIEGITRIVVEEGTELTFADFKELNRRIRGVEGCQITFMFNPIDKGHWLKEHFYDGMLKNTTLISVTHHDNQFLLPEDRDELESLKDFDENQYKIYCLAEWGSLKTGSEFYPHFSYAKHTGKASFLKGKPIHISYDFNVLPYMPLVCCQIIENVVRWKNPVTKKRFKEFTKGFEIEYVTQVRFFRIYMGKQGNNPENTTKSVSEAFRRDFESKGSEVFFYGDASGKYRMAGKGDSTNFKDVKKTLAGMLNNASDRVGSSNPPVLKARDFMNRIFMNRYAIEILIDDENCSELADDLATILVGKDGLHKEMVKDKATGISYQKNSHLSDAFKYMVIWLFKDLFKSAE